MVKATVKQAIEIVKMRDFGAPVEHIADYLRYEGIDRITVYHITPSANLESIRTNGITAKSCYNREGAVYFFLDYDDVPGNAPIVVGDVDYDVLIIDIPAETAVKIKYDGLFNGNFKSSYSAARLEQNISAEWIMAKVKK